MHIVKPLRRDLIKANKNIKKKLWKVGMFREEKKLDKKVQQQYQDFLS